MSRKDDMFEPEQSMTITNEYGLTTTVTETSIVNTYNGVSVSVTIGQDVRCGKGFNGRLDEIAFNDAGDAEITVSHCADQLRYIYGAHQVWSPELSIYNPAFKTV